MQTPRPTQPNRLAALFSMMILGGLATGLPQAAQAGLVQIDVTAVQLADNGSGFSSPTVTFINNSDAGYNITNTQVTNAFFDYIATASVVAPSGGTSVPIGGTQLSTGNPNDGCTPVNFNHTSFGSTDSFQFRADPENNACANVVYDWRTRLNANQPAATVTITGPDIVGSLVLSGNVWEMELIDPDGSTTDVLNQLYRLILTETIETAESVPEPTGVALLGLSLAGVAAVTRRRRPRQG